MTLTPLARAPFSSLVLSVMLLAAAPSISAQDAPLAPYRANYEVLRNGLMQGMATITLERTTDGNWDFRTQTTGTRGLAGLAGIAIFEQSILRWRERRPELVRYTFDQHAAWKSRKRSLSLGGDTILSNFDGHEAAFAREPGVVDRHAVVLALAADLAAGASHLSYRVADKDKIETHTYRNAGEEPTEVPAGRYETVRVERVREKPGRTTTSWLAPVLGYMPVRIVQREPDGETLEMRLRERPKL